VVKSSPEDVSAHIFLAQFHHANHDPGGAKFELNLAHQLSTVTESLQDDLEVQLAAMEMELQRNSSQTAERWFKRQASTLAGKHPNSARFQVNLVHARLLLVEGRAPRMQKN